MDIEDSEIKWEDSEIKWLKRDPLNGGALCEDPNLNIDP